MNTYSETVVEHSRHPRNFTAIAEPQISQEGLNPLCGDRIRIEVALDGDIVRAAGFQGDLCAIAKAAGSLLTEMIRGLPIDRIRELGEEEILEALHAEIQPSRRKCATLPLEALQAGVDAWHERSSE